MPSPAVSMAVEVFKTHARRERAYTKSQIDLEKAVAAMTPDELSEYAQITEDISQTYIEQTHATRS